MPSGDFKNSIPLKSSETVSEIIPGCYVPELSVPPFIVNVLPELVCPYASTVTLKPLSALLIMSFKSASNISYVVVF